MKDRLLDVPERYRDGLKRYAQDHVEPGGFLRAVLENNLAMAIARFDRDRSLAELRIVVQFVHNDLMPGTCHGSAGKVKTWLARRGEAECIHCSKRLGDEPWYDSQPARGAGV